MRTQRILQVMLACVLTTFATANVVSAAERPNVVFIVSDDQGWGDFGFMGHKQIQTPHLDKLAGESLVFRRGYVPSSLCCPSLAALLTGKYPQQTKITGNEPPAPVGKPLGERYRNPEFLAQVKEMNGFMAQHPRVPAELGKAGYLSFQAGKWWAGNFKTGGFTHGMSHGDSERGGRHGDDGLTIGRKSMKPIFEFIEQSKGKPFFLWYAPMMPHQPHNPPERLLQKYQAKTPSLHMARYWAMCEWFDETCGELLGFLDKKKLRDNTIVVFLIDNGWIQEPDKAGYRADSKQSQYDAGLRTPIMIRWPTKIKPRLDDTPVSSIDIAPTIYRACGLEVPAGLSGVNLLDAAKVKSRKAIFGECFLHTAIDIRAPEKNLTYRWCVAGDWKLIVPNVANVKKPNKPDRKTEIELYDVAKDPTEEKNLAAERPEQLQRLTHLLDAWWKP